MQINSPILAILVIACFLGIKAIPLTPIEQQIVRVPPPSIFTLCGAMGTTCTSTTDCCQPYECDYTGGYDGSTKSCCGGEDAIGCTVGSDINGGGCCAGYECVDTGAPEKTTVCIPQTTK